MTHGDDFQQEGRCPFHRLSKRVGLSRADVKPPSSIPEADGGRWIHTWRMIRHPLLFVRSLYRSHGPVVRFRFLNRSAVLLSGPKARELAATASDPRLDRQFFYGQFAKEMGADKVIFGATGKAHAAMRKTASQAFSRHLAVSKMRQSADAMRRILVNLRVGQTVDVAILSQELAQAGFTPIVTSRAFPRDIEQDIELYCRTVSQVCGRVRPKLWLAKPNYRNARMRVRRHLRQCVECHREQRVSTGRGGLIDQVLFERESGEETLSDDDVISLCLLGFFGANEYVGRLISMMVYHIYRDERLLKAVRQEIDAVFGDDCAEFSVSRRLPLLRAVYFETLRMYPIWFVVPFQARTDFEFEGHEIKQGQLFVVSSVQEHYSEQFYKNPDRFDPWRCLPPRNEHLQPGGYFPFGAGDRRCVAAGLTELLAMLAVGTLLNKTEMAYDLNYQLRFRLELLPKIVGLRFKFNGFR